MNGGASAFWQFSLRYYRRAEVPAACLSLQDEQGIDVNLLFFILFLAINQRQISADEIRRMAACVSEWRTRVVQPLRAIRRDLKSGIAPVDAVAAEALRSAIKRDELQAERLQQEILEREFPPASVGSHAPARVAAEANIAAFGTVGTMGTLGTVGTVGTAGTVGGTLPAAHINTLLTALREEFSV
jgi:uncharacterized protein (TIGR02444 family)